MDKTEPRIATLADALRPLAKVNLEREPCDYGPEGCFEDDEIVAAVRADYEAGNQWAWCDVCVTASYLDFTSAPYYLGGCSYDSEEDFRADAYFSDLVDEALNSLAAEMLAIHEAVSRLLHKGE
jgi:hypothetical protein